MPDSNEIGSNQEHTLITTAIVTSFKSSYPLLRFIGILSFVCCGINILLGIGTLISGVYILDMFDHGTNIGVLGNEPAYTPVWLSGISSIIGGVIYFFPALFVYNFGTKLRDFSQTNSMPSLNLAFKNNKSLWKFVGILCIISTAGMILLLPVFVVLFLAISAIKG